MNMIIGIDVDENMLKTQAGDGESLKNALAIEFGWLQGSGIVFNYIIEKKESEMLIEIGVNVDVLKETSDEDESIESILAKEFGWLQQSGITFKGIILFKN